jgi:hypothetical protein
MPWHRAHHGTSTVSSTTSRARPQRQGPPLCGICAPSSSSTASSTSSSNVARLADASHAWRLHDELRKLGRYPLPVEEVGYIPFRPYAAKGSLAT